MEEQSNRSVEVEFIKGKKSFFILAFEDGAIWLDIKIFPEKLFLCAALDGIEIIQAKCGKYGRKKRIFLPIDWIINNWGGASDKVIKILKEKKQTALEKLEIYKENNFYEEA